MFTLPSYKITDVAVETKLETFESFNFPFIDSNAAKVMRKAISKIS